MNGTLARLDETMAQDKTDAWDTQWTNPGHPTWDAFAIAEPTTNEHRNASRKNPSIYDSVEIDHQVFFRHYRKADQDSEPPTPSETEASETEPGNEAESSQDKQSTRVMKLFGIRKFNDQGDGAGKSYHLQDNMYGNVNLYSVNEDGSPMDFDSALSFFSRNSRLINERVQQLQSQQSKVFQSICGHSPYAPTFPLQISVSYPPTSIYPGRRHLTGTSMRVSTRKALSTKCVSRRRQQDGFRR